MVASCKWHSHKTKPNTCTNSDDYPVIWDREHQDHKLLLDTAKECCDFRFPNAEEECVTIDDCTSDAIKLHPNQNLDEIPWNFGNPPQWRVSSDDPQSVTNIHVERELGATADLSLRLIVPDRAVLVCAAKIDVSQPFDSFSLIVNGLTEYTYQHKVLNGEQQTELETGLTAGENRVVFRVENTHMNPGIDRQNGVRDYGSGRVWMQCRIISV